MNLNGELKREEEDMELDSNAVNPIDLVGGDEDEEEKEVSAEELERLMIKVGSARRVFLL